MVINSGEKFDVYYRYERRVEGLYQRLMDGESMETVFAACWDDMMKKELEKRLKKLPSIEPPDRTQYLVEIAEIGRFMVIDKKNGHCAMVSPSHRPSSKSQEVQRVEGIHKAAGEVHKAYEKNQEGGTEIIQIIAEIAVEQRIFRSDYLPKFLQIYSYKQE